VTVRAAEGQPATALSAFRRVTVARRLNLIDDNGGRCLGLRWCGLLCFDDFNAIRVVALPAAKWPEMPARPAVCRVTLRRWLNLINDEFIGRPGLIRC
jgi:hypothetical protein